jgi:hypothetical protein
MERKMAPVSRLERSMSRLNVQIEFKCLRSARTILLDVARHVSDIDRVVGHGWNLRFGCIVQARA